MAIRNSKGMQYQELEQYLLDAQNEIAQVFDRLSSSERLYRNDGQLLTITENVVGDTSTAEMLLRSSNSQVENGIQKLDKLEGLLRKLSFRNGDANAKSMPNSKVNELKASLRLPLIHPPTELPNKTNDANRRSYYDNLHNQTNLPAPMDLEELNEWASGLLQEINGYFDDDFSKKVLKVECRCRDDCSCDRCFKKRNCKTTYEYLNAESGYESLGPITQKDVENNNFDSSAFKNGKPRLLSQESTSSAGDQWGARSDSCQSDSEDLTTSVSARCGFMEDLTSIDLDGSEEFVRLEPVKRNEDIVVLRIDSFSSDGCDSDIFDVKLTDKQIQVSLESIDVTTLPGGGKNEGLGDSSTAFRMPGKTVVRFQSPFTSYVDRIAAEIEDLALKEAAFVISKSTSVSTSRTESSDLNTVIFCLRSTQRLRSVDSCSTGTQTSDVSPASSLTLLSDEACKSCLNGDITDEDINEYADKMCLSDSFADEGSMANGNVSSSSSNTSTVSDSFSLSEGLDSIGPGDFSPALEHRIDVTKFAHRRALNDNHGTLPSSYKFLPEDPWISRSTGYTNGSITIDSTGPIETNAIKALEVEVYQNLNSFNLTNYFNGSAGSDSNLQNKKFHKPKSWNLWPKTTVLSPSSGKANSNPAVNSRLSRDRLASLDDSSSTSSMATVTTHGDTQLSSPMYSSSVETPDHSPPLKLKIPIGSTMRSQSVQAIAELESLEACRWLRAAGFPQYAQMFEDLQFPVDIESVRTDHDFLDQDSIQSLFRRLHTLNKCAKMRLDATLPRKIRADRHVHNHHHHHGDNGDEIPVALSDQWMYQRGSRRWSRVGEELCLKPSNADGCEVVTPDDMPSGCISQIKRHSGGSSAGVSRSGSDRLKDGAKAFLRRVESLKSRKHKRTNREVVVLSGSQTLDTGEEPATNYLQTWSGAPSPDSGNQSPRDLSSPGGNDSPPPTLIVHSDSQTEGTVVYDPLDGCVPVVVMGFDECPTNLSDSAVAKEGESKSDSSDGTKEKRERKSSASLSQSATQWRYLQVSSDSRVNLQTGSFNLGSQSANYREQFWDRQKSRSARISGEATSEKKAGGRKTRRKLMGMRKGFSTTAAPSQREEKLLGGNHSIQQDIAGGSSSDISTLQDNHHSDYSTDDLLASQYFKVVSRWSGVLSLASPEHRALTNSVMPIISLSSTQLMVLQKWSLLKLTSLIERHTTINNRTAGWNWGIPKFMKRHHKSTDVKDKTALFGVSLSVLTQRHGHPLPLPILVALSYLSNHAKDAVGLFRKPGVRSRIQRLKQYFGTLNLNDPLCAEELMVYFEEQQVYDVADVVKLFFRELPEALLTNKLSEAFISIYKYISKEHRVTALKSAVLLLPDENREVLEVLMTFLADMAASSELNQMSASNLAMCFAPSLFHLGSSRSASTSPRRRKTMGVPDQKELTDNRAAYDCLTDLIDHHDVLFNVSDDCLNQLRLTETDRPASLDELGEHWKTYMNDCVDSIVKECRDKWRGWVTVSTNQADSSIALAYRKLDDRCPLWLWRCTVDIEAPPTELLSRLINERHMYELDFGEWRCLYRLGANADVVQYTHNRMAPFSPVDYCVLRYWQTDLSKNACVLVETSVENNFNLEPISTNPNCVRGTVLVSRYLIEPCGAGKSRLTHISRLDTRGHSPDWYNRLYGHTAALNIARLRNSFQHILTVGPESKI